MIVAETNLFFYLFVKGQRTSQAEAVLQHDPAWAAPLRWRSDFRNTLMGLVRRKEWELEGVLGIVKEVEQWIIGREFTVVSHHVLQ